MGVFSDALDREVRLQRMRPEQVEQARAQCLAIYVAFGSIEWHGRHNPVGLDTIKAHEQLVGLAVQVGGVVYPAVFFGAGGGHLLWPSSFMVSAEPMRRLVTDLLAGFERDGYRKAILLSGHYPNRREYLDAAVEAYRPDGGSMDVLAIVETQIPGGKGDHASLYETSSMLYLHPETVDRDTVGEPSAGVDPEDATGHNWMNEEHRDHPCYGLVGIDPRGRASTQLGKHLTDNLIEFLREWVET